MGDVAQFQVRPPLRCYQQLPDSAIATCGDLAEYQRIGAGGLQVGYFCAAHRQATDVPIAGATTFRRVSVQIELLLAGTSPIPAMAQAEAVARLEAALERIHGLVNLSAVTSAIGRYEPPPPPLKGKGGRQKAIPAALKHYAP